ncbi:hypothetical protein C8F04DRAFT_1186933 [Mycena alexandri]|uniref:Uncharacterized protein n=1 Tax=Mycena alexandri TaxID=1745969 RepID=A0AAD6WZI2_9AGAR|nr:hypothetical protein C8F04DRAFT_1186933 [Mycena alexandri]
MSNAPARDFEILHGPSYWKDFHERRRARLARAALVSSNGSGETFHAISQPDMVYTFVPGRPDPIVTLSGAPQQKPAAPRSGGGVVRHTKDRAHTQAMVDIVRRKEPGDFVGKSDAEIRAHMKTPRGKKQLAAANEASAKHWAAREEARKAEGDALQLADAEEVRRTRGARRGRHLPGLTSESVLSDFFFTAMDDADLAPDTGRQVTEHCWRVDGGRQWAIENLTNVFRLALGSPAVMQCICLVSQICIVPLERLPYHTVAVRAQAEERERFARGSVESWRGERYRPPENCGRELIRAEQKNGGSMEFDWGSKNGVKRCGRGVLQAVDGRGRPISIETTQSPSALDNLGVHVRDGLSVHALGAPATLAPSGVFVPSPSAPNNRPTILVHGDWGSPTPREGKGRYPGGGRPNCQCTYGGEPGLCDWRTKSWTGGSGVEKEQPFEVETMQTTVASFGKQTSIMTAGKKLLTASRASRKKNTEVDKGVIDVPVMHYGCEWASNALPCKSI